jgi:hypothetical protein
MALGVPLVIDAGILLALVAVTGLLRKTNPVTFWRFTFAGGALALIAALATWLFDMPRAIAIVVVWVAVLGGFLVDVIRLSRRHGSVPLGEIVRAPRRTADLDRLTDLRDRGVLTEEEYRDQRRQLGL